MKPLRLLTRFMNAMVGSGRDEQHNGYGSGQQANEMDYLPRSRQVFEIRGEYNRKLKSKERLCAGQGHTAFNQDFFDAISKIRLVTVISFLPHQITSNHLLCAGPAAYPGPAAPQRKGKVVCS